MFTRPISLGTEGRQFIVSGIQCSYRVVIPCKEGKVKEIIHIYDYYYDYLYDYYQIKIIFVNLY